MVSRTCRQPAGCVLQRRTRTHTGRGSEVLNVGSVVAVHPTRPLTLSKSPLLIPFKPMRRGAFWVRVDVGLLVVPNSAAGAGEQQPPHHQGWGALGACYSLGSREAPPSLQVWACMKPQMFPCCVVTHVLGPARRPLPGPLGFQEVLVCCC